MKKLKKESAGNSGYSSSRASSAELENHPWKTDDTNRNTVMPSWQEQIVSSSRSRGTGLSVSSQGTGLAALSNNNGYNNSQDDDDEFTDADELDVISECSSYANEFRGECYAPPGKDLLLVALAPANLCFKTNAKPCPLGKLGVVLDSINNVVVVHRLKPGSPLEGVLKLMDRIIAVDDIDTSRMSATEVTKVMVSKMRKTRKITYIRGGNIGVDSQDLEELRGIRNNGSM